MEKLILLLNELESFIDQCPSKGRSRFGDGAYRDWHTKLEQVQRVPTNDRRDILIVGERTIAEGSSARSIPSLRRRTQRLPV